MVPAREPLERDSRAQKAERALHWRYPGVSCSQHREGGRCSSMGALYEIATALVTRCDGERSVVDRLEGHRTTRDPENYAKICVTVDLYGESATAWTYVG